jgi:putative membrane protein
MNMIHDMLAEYISWLLAFHILAVIAWMAGMLYLPRLFVYHTQTIPGASDSERFKVMERKLLKRIINPSMIAVWILGLILAWVTRAYMEHWLQIKFVLVLVMSGVHGLYVRWVKDFAADRNRHGERFYRIVNEAPAVLLVFIVILAVVKPFS